jgi:hypothetical protein
MGYAVCSETGVSRAARNSGFVVLLVCVPFVMSQQACTTFAFHRAQSVPPATPRPQKLVIVPARSKPGIERASIDTVGRSAAGGAGKGLVAGVGAGLVLTLQVGLASGGLGLLLLPVFVGIGAAVGTVGGTAVGAVQGIPEQGQIASRRTAERALDPRYVQALLAASVLEAGRPLSHGALEVTAIAEPIAIDTQTDYKALAQKGHDYALETEVVQLGFEGTGGKRPWVAFFMTARARLVELPSGKPVYQRTFAYVRGYRQLSYWADNDGRAAREGAVWAYADLGSRIAEEIYLHPLSGPVQVKVADADSTPERHACELAPAKPNASADANRQEPIQSAPATYFVAESQPTLRWQSLSETTGLSGEDAGRLSEAGDIRYDIKIWREASLGAGELVYERSGLTETSHRVEEPLAQGATYDWSVRARFTLNGLPRGTRWGSLAAPDYSDKGGILKRTYQSQPELMKRLAPNGFIYVDADGAHFSPCLLDFIPGANYFRFHVAGGAVGTNRTAGTASKRPAPA